MSSPKRPRLDPELENTASDAEADFTDATTVLANVQLELERVNREAHERILEVERDANRQRQPFYKRRSDAIAQIAGFWRDVLQEHEQLQALISEDDAALLGHLMQLEVEEFEDIKTGYRLTFRFAPNGYFEDEELRRELRWDGSTGQLHITAPQPKWKPDKDYTLPVRHKRSNRAEAPPSFMTWLTSAEVSGDEDEVAEIIRSEIWPNPLKIFLPKEEGSAGDDEESGDDSEASGSEDDQDGDDEDHQAGYDDDGVVDLTEDVDLPATNGAEDLSQDLEDGPDCDDDDESEDGGDGGDDSDNDAAVGGDHEQLSGPKA